MTRESVKEFYDRQYRFHAERQLPCPNALHDLAKARRRVDAVIRGFGIANCSQGTEILDVGSGLGYYTRALSMTGATVTGIDFSEVAIEAATSRFPECRFVHAAWPEGVSPASRFDLIWMVNFSLMNTFDVQFIDERLIAEALLRLKPGGHLVVGWNSDFSGRVKGGYSHWSREMLRRLQRSCQMSAPMVGGMPSALASWVVIRLAHAWGRSIPIFIVKQKQASPSP